MIMSQNEKNAILLQTVADKAKTNLRMVRLCLAAGADANTKNDKGKTVLIYAASQNDSTLVKILLNSGADINAKTKDGVTALHHAASWNDSETIEILLDSGANPTLEDHKGQRPSAMCEDKETKEVLLQAEKKWVESHKEPAQDKKTPRNLPYPKLIPGVEF